MLEVRTPDDAFVEPIDRGRASQGRLHADPVEPAAGEPAPTCSCAAAGMRNLPVLIILHQLQSTPGHVGQWLVRNGYPLDIRRPRFGDPLPQTMRHHAGAVIFGGPMSANDPDDYIRAETEWIGVPLVEQKPFLGICLGAQMLANHLGSAVAYHPDQHVEIGYHRVVATPAAQAICDWPDRFYQWHKEGFDVPRTATLLATSDGPFANQAFVFGGAAVALQFHPEITYAQVHRWTGNNIHRLHLPGAQPREEHLRGHFVHAPRVHGWMDRFMSRWLAGEIGRARGGTRRVETPR